MKSGQILLGTAAALILLSGCGASVTHHGVNPAQGQASFASSAPAQPKNTSAECNAFSAPNQAIGGLVTTYYSNGTILPDRVRIRLNKLASQFSSAASTGQVQIKIYRAKTVGSSILPESTPTTFMIERGTTGTYPISGIMSSINLNDVNAIRSYQGVPGTTALEFFANTVVVVNGLDFSWQALRIVVSQSSTVGETILGESTFLIPAFEADPNEYEKTHISALNQLHPFWSSRTLAGTDWVFRSRSNCF